MIYSEYINAGGKGIIELLYQNQALKFLPADLVTPLDHAYTLQNGYKLLTDNVANTLTSSHDLTDIALELKAIYADLWNIIYQAQPDALVTSKTTVAGNGTTDTKNTVAGYDSDTMVDDNAVNQTNSTSTSTTNTDYATLATIMEQLRKTNVWRRIKADLNNYLFITVYN